MAQLGEAEIWDKRDLLSLRAFRRNKIVTASRMLRGKPRPPIPLRALSPRALRIRSVPRDAEAI